MNPRLALRRLGDFAGAMRSYRALTHAGTSRDELLALQQRRLVETARHAVARSAFYRELYAGIELADDLDVRALPVISKQLVMENFDAIVTDPRLRLAEVDAHIEQIDGDTLYLGEYRCMPTGGTTGRRGIFVYDRAEWRDCLAGFLRWSELTETRPRLGRRERIANVGATNPLHMTARFALSIDLGLYAMRRLDARMPIANLVNDLNAHQPSRLIGYPSSLSLLAFEQLEGRLRISPKTVSTTSEVRTEEMTANIRAAWAVEPFNMFGTTESLYAGDCPHHTGMHLFEDMTLAESVDERNEPVPDGVAGSKLLITSFVKRTQPLLRYEISDLAAITSEPCPCGRPLARFRSLDGRSDDILMLAGAGGAEVAIHPLTLRSPMAAVPELRAYKVIHDEAGLHVQIALRGGADAGAVARRVEARLREMLSEAGAADPRLDVTVVAELARDQGHSGKFKLIESRLTPRPGAAAPH